jgi:3-oxoacyl-[acyl-carrier protein] reductase
MRVEEARILITGGARGIGRRFARDLLEHGARVGICDMDAAGLTAAREEAAAGGRALWTAEADVSSEGSVEELFAGFVADHGGIDVLVNNAGVTRDALLVKVKDGQVQKMPLDSWQLVVDVNLTGVFLCGREAASYMVRQESGGLIVSISSISRHGTPGQSNYTATKAAVAAMSVVWAKELARYKVRAAAIAPGYVATEMTQAIRPEILDKIVAQIPWGRMGDPGEISHTLRFIIENEYVNGRVIEVDGGLRI